MKLRIKGDTLRLRLSRPEVDRIANEGAVSDEIKFAPGVCLRYSLALAGDIREVAADYKDNEIHVRIPTDRGRAWATSEQEVGIERPGPADGAPRILIEKDFQCLVDRPGEDESDNFPHPQDGEKSC